MDPIIKVRGIEVIYQKGTPSEIQALKTVDMDVNPNEFLIIFGPSGCGKSTMLYSISGAETAIEKGEILYKGKNIREMDKREFIMYHREAVGLIFQDHHLIPTLNVLNNVTLPLIFSGVPKSERKKRGLEQLARFGIQEIAYKMPSQLSGGQQQRAGIARALINNPDIILADEPTGNLDSVSAVNVLNILKELKEKYNKTVVLVTHEGQYLSYADRVVFMKDGNVVDETAQTAQKKPTPVGMDEKAKELHMHAIKTLDYLGLNSVSEEYYRMEEALRSFLDRKITKDRFYEVLHTPIKDGGVGLYKQRAQKVVDDIAEMMEIKEIVRGVQYDNKEIASAKIGYLTDWLFAAYKGHLDAEQKKMVSDLISQRIKGKINHPQFEQTLDLPREKMGVGLNSHTARNLAKKIEVVI